MTLKLTYLIYFQLLSITLLLLFSAFFSGAETALTRLSTLKVKHWIFIRSANREAWINWLSKPQELITTILVGNTLANIFLSSLTASLATALLPANQPEWIQIFAGFLAFIFILIFGEIVPKIYGRQNPEKVSSRALPFLFGLARLIGTPLRRFLLLLGRAFPIFKETPPGRISTFSLEDIRLILKNPSSVRGLNPDQADMMRKVLDSHHRPLQEIMTPWKDVDALILDRDHLSFDKINHLVDLWVESGHTRMPVVSGSPPQLIGYLFTKDLLDSAAHDRTVDSFTIHKWLRPLPRVSAEKKVGEVVDLFRFGSPIACVQDRTGFPLGLVTLEDILEEFVGEILDEYDLEEKQSHE